MEKPRKPAVYTYLPITQHEKCVFEYGNQLGKSQMFDTMSAWIEGELPTEKDLGLELSEVYNAKEGEGCADHCRRMAQAIHALITRKLTGNG